MNLWLIAAIGFLLPVIPCGVLAVKTPMMDVLVAVQFATNSCVLALLAIAIGLSRPSFLDISLTLALLAYPSSLLFPHFFERWL